VRELFYSFEGALSAGLNPRKVKRDRNYLDKCYGWEPVEEGLRGETAISNPVSGSFHDEAQFLEGEGLYLLDYTQDSDETASIKPVTGWTLGSDILTTGTVDKADGDSGSVEVVSDGLPFWCVEREGIWLFGNSSVFLTNSGIYSGWVGGDQSIARVPRSVCLVGDRLAMGGFQTSLGWATDLWSAVWEEWQRTTPEFAADGSTMDDGWVMLGPKAGGAADFPWAFELTLMAEYLAVELKPTILRLIRDREIDFVKVPRGVVLGLMEHNSGLMIYGSEGVWRWTSDGRLQEVLPKGIASRTAFCGTAYDHYFVDTEEHLWRITTDGVQKLWYDVWIDDLTQASIRMFMYRPNKWVYITDGSTTYAYNGSGMWKSIYTPNSVLQQGELYGTVSAGDTTRYFESTPRDVSLNAYKKLNHVEVQFVGCTSMTVQGAVKSSQSSAAVYGPAIPINTEGVAYIGLAGVTVGVKVSCTASADAMIYNVRAGYHKVDRRYNRGLEEGQLYKRGAEDY